MTDLVFDYKIQKIARIFEEDNVFKKALIQYRVYIPDIYIGEKNPERIKMYEELAELFLQDYDFISDRTIDDLWKLQFRVNRINQILKKENVVDYNLYKIIIFTFKYSTIKHFFENNFYKFLPSPDASVIYDNEKMKLFQIAFMKEYDRFADIIDSIYDIVDVDKVDNQYLPYLVQLLGYEKGDDRGMLSNEAFRQLAKNIIEVYKIKGTNYSFELFFNFLGFEVTLYEYWFDKRFSDPGISINPYTGSSNPLSFSYYLTPYNPTEYIPKGMLYPYQVAETDLTDIRSSLWFERKIKEGVPIEKLLKLNPQDPPEEGFDYTFFKTNIIKYDIQRIRSKDTDSDELSPEDEKIINAYADFLTPIFIMKMVSVSVSPFEDLAEKLILSDTSMWDNKLKTIVNMYHQGIVKFLIDDWVKDPLDKDNRAPLIPIELTDLETPTEGSEDRIESKEEPRVAYIWINSTFDNTNKFFSNDFMKQIYDRDYMVKINNNEIEFAPTYYFKVEVKTSEYIDNNRNEDRLWSLWDIYYNDYKIQQNVLTYLAGINGSLDDDINKILNFEEDAYFRMRRIEIYDIFNRDYFDWEDFYEIRVIPNVSDSGDMLIPINEFSSIISGNQEMFLHTDDGASDTPWLFYDELTIIKHI